MLCFTDGATEAQRRSVTGLGSQRPCPSVPSDFIKIPSKWVQSFQLRDAERLETRGPGVPGVLLGYKVEA